MSNMQIKPSTQKQSEAQIQNTNRTIRTWGVKNNGFQVNGEFSGGVTWSGVSMDDLDWTSSRVQTFRVQNRNVIGSVVCQSVCKVSCITPFIMYLQKTIYIQKKGDICELLCLIFLKHHSRKIMVMIVVYFYFRYFFIISCLTLSK